MRLLGECRGSIDTMKRMGFELKEDEDTVSGLADPSSSESQTSGHTTCQPILLTYNILYHVFNCLYERVYFLVPLTSGLQLTSDLYYLGVIERWELLQAQDLSKEMRTKQNQQQWQQLISDLNNVWAWLGETGEELEQQQRLDFCTNIQTIEQRIKKLKVLLVSFLLLLNLYFALYSSPK